MARQLLRLISTRYGLALVLLLLVIVAVGVARSVSNQSTSATVVAPPTTSTGTAVAGGRGASNSTGTTLGDDGVATSEAPESPAVSAGSAPPEAVALDFANAWLHTKDVTGAAWFKGMQPYLTQRLIDLLQGATPDKVPATGIRGAVQITSRSAGLVEASVPVNPGTLRLNLVVVKGRWLVDTLSWDRA